LPWRKDFLHQNHFSSLTQSKTTLTASVRHLSGSKFALSQFDQEDMVIKQLVSNPYRLSISNHAKLRFKGRKIQIDHIRSALSSGRVSWCRNGFEKGVAKAEDKASGVRAIISLDKFLIITAYQVYKSEKKSKHQYCKTIQKLGPFSMGCKTSTQLNQQTSTKIVLDSRKPHPQKR